MSDPIQSISQSNYILHNIDAKKLYVQEPLFTANSGDAVYVGWRPDETVLWENNGSFSAKGLTASFSEPASAFERLMFVCGTDTQSKNCSVVEYHPGSASINWPEFYSNGFRYWQTTFNISDTRMTAGPAFFCQWTYSTATNAWTKGNTDWDWCYKGIKKVIGINRKENA